MRNSISSQNSHGSDSGSDVESDDPEAQERIAQLHKLISTLGLPVEPADKLVIIDSPAKTGRSDSRRPSFTTIPEDTELQLVDDEDNLSPVHCSMWHKDSPGDEDLPLNITLTTTPPTEPCHLRPTRSLPSHYKRNRPKPFRVNVGADVHYLQPPDMPKSPRPLERNSKSAASLPSHMGEHMQSSLTFNSEVEIVSELQDHRKDVHGFPGITVPPWEDDDCSQNLRQTRVVTWPSSSSSQHTTVVLPILDDEKPKEKLNVRRHSVNVFSNLRSKFPIPRKKEKLASVEITTWDV